MMVSTKQIFKEFEEKSNEIIINRAFNILTDVNLFKTSIDLFLDFSNPVVQLYYLKYYLYDKEFKEQLFKILNKYDYNNNEEIKDFIKELYVSSRENNSNEIVNKYINSPYIDNIKLNKDSVIIYSKQLGDYEAIRASRYFKNYPWISSYIAREQLEQMCHKHVAFLTINKPSLYSITSLCSRKFNNFTYYHSYCYDRKTNRVIDLCSDLIMDKDSYDKLFKTKEVFKIKGKDLREAYHIAIGYDLSLSRKYEAIASTLFQQYIWENEFKVPDNNIYSEEPSNSKLLIKNRFK